MKNTIPKSDFSINSILGEETSFEGQFNIKGPLRIDGYFKGKINSTGRVYIGKLGKAEDTIVAKSVVVGGIFKGDLYAEDKVTVLKTGKIYGNIYSGSIKMEDGVIFDGECSTLSKPDIKDLVAQKRGEKYYPF